MAHKGLKIVCVAICCIALITILIVPSFALEVDSRVVDNVVDNQFYMFDTSNTDTSLYYVDCSMYRFYVFSLVDGSLTVYTNVWRIWFSNSGISINYFVDTTMYGADIVTTDNYQDVVFAFDSILGATGNNTAFLRYLNTTSYFVQDVVTDLENEAYLVGKREGFENGRVQGKREGFDEGYRTAVDEMSDGGTWSTLGDFFVNVVGSFTEAELFYGFTIGTILSLFVGAILFFWFIKLLR